MKCKVFFSQVDRCVIVVEASSEDEAKVKARKEWMKDTYPNIEEVSEI